MKPQFWTGLAAAFVAVLSACNNSNNTTPPLAGDVRVANGITDSNGLDTSISNVPVSSGQTLDTASGLNDVPDGSYKAQLTSNSVQFTVNNVSLDHNHDTTIFGTGQVANGTEGGFPAEVAINAPTNGQFVVQPIDAALQAAGASGTLSFYIVKPGTGLTGTPLTAAYAASPPSMAIAGGTYEILVTNGATVLFDSGPKGIALPNGNANVYQLAALDAGSANTTKYGSAIMVLLMDQTGGQAALFNLQN
jgi:hypothetical protein